MEQEFGDSIITNPLPSKRDGLIVAIDRVRSASQPKIISSSSLCKIKKIFEQSNNVAVTEYGVVKLQIPRFLLLEGLFGGDFFKLRLSYRPIR